VAEEDMVAGQAVRVEGSLLRKEKSKYFYLMDSCLQSGGPGNPQ